MHSTKIDDVTVHYNGNYSGTVLLTLPREKVEDALAGNVFVEVEFDVLRKLVLNYLRDKLISHIENMDYDELEVKTQVSMDF